jgi:hypothetical protein
VKRTKIEQKGGTASLGLVCESIIYCLQNMFFAYYFIKQLFYCHTSQLFANIATYILIDSDNKEA